jgi:hypothetical protein
MKKKLFSFIFLLSIPWLVCSQTNDSTSNHRSYPFLIQDSPSSLFTMRQVDIAYVSGSRLYATWLNKTSKPFLSYLLQSAGFILFLGPLTHEEAHRAILTGKNIGSVSRPFLFSERGGYVDGVSDQTLKDLRDYDFPDYTRLYIAGLESDYMLTHREETLFAFSMESTKNFYIEYILRKVFLMQYYLMGFLHYDIDGLEEANELERDVVGNDVYGVVRHLHRPSMEFHRYTRYNDLSSIEKNYVRKMGFRSFLNLLNCNIIGINSFKINDNLSVNAGLGHTMCPFGDFIDENLWIHFLQKVNLETYFRQFQNADHWFMAGGIGIHEYPIGKKLNSSVSLHWWNQPEQLRFVESRCVPGGALEAQAKYTVFAPTRCSIKSISVDLGFIYKSYGYLPEEIQLSRHFGVNVGTTFLIDK